MAASSQSAVDAGNGQTPLPADYVPERQCPTRVFVNGVRVPAAETDVHIRKEGPLSVTRYAEAAFASPWASEDYLTVFDTLGEDQSRPDILRIDTYDSDAEQHIPLFFGVVTGVGGSPEHDNEKLFQVRGQGPAHYLENIAASKTFSGRGVTALNVVEYITAELDAALPADISITSPSRETESADTPLGVGPPEPTLDSINILPGKELLYTPKTFTANKHDLSDVAAWLQDKIAGRMWIEPTETGGEVVLTDEPTSVGVEHTAHYLDGGTTKVINNNALSELHPINTIIVNGRAKKSLLEVGEFELNVPSETFVKVKARHKRLYKASGDTELTAKVTKSDAESEQETVNEARSKLKAKVDESTAGSLQVVHDTHVRPFDTITARPTINEQPVADVPAITYEVNRVHYKTRPNKEGVVPHIDCNVGIHTDMDDDIEIIRSWREDA